MLSLCISLAGGSAGVEASAYAMEIGDYQGSSEAPKLMQRGLTPQLSRAFRLAATDLAPLAWQIRRHGP
jgi:hypothetical protein